MTTHNMDTQPTIDETMSEAEDFIRRILKKLPFEERFFGLKPEEYLEGLNPEERLAGLEPEERMAGLEPEERMVGLEPEERLAGLEPEIIEAYLETNEWEGRAGACCIQGMGEAFVRSLEGSYSNVVGLPLHKLFEGLTEVGFSGGAFWGATSGE